MTVELGQKLMPILTISTSGMGYFVKAMSAIIDFALKHSGAIITLTSSIAAYTVIAKIEAYWLEKTFQARMANMAAAKASKIAKEAETKATELGIVATLNQQMADNAATEAKELRIAASKAKKAADIAETTTTELQTAATEAQILADEASATSKELNNKAITSKKLAEAAATKATGLNTAAIEAQALADKSATKTTILGTIATKASELAKKTGTAATLLFAAAKAILNRDIGRASAAMRLFNTTVGMSPLGVLAAALAVVIGTFVVLASKMTEAQRVMKTLIDVETEATKNTLEQKVSLEQLWQIANDHKRSLEDRKHAIEEINKISPKFLGDITLETIGTEKATKAKEAYIESLLKEARVKAAKDKLVEIGKKILDIQSGNEDQVSWYEKTFNMFISTGNYASTMARNAESDIRNSNKEIKKLTAEQTALAKIATDNQVMNLTIEEEITKKLREMHKETNNQKKIDLVKEIEILKKRAKAIADAKEKEDATYNPNKDLSKGEKEAAKKRIELEKTYQDMLIAIMDDGRLKEIANENKKHEENLVNFKEHKKLTELEEIRHQKELRSIEEKYSVEKLESKKSPLFNEPKLAAFQENPEMRQKILEAEYERKLYEETAAGKKEILADLLATNEISEKEYNDRIRQMDRELLAEKLEMYNEKFGQLFSSIDQIITNSEQRELNKYKKAQDAKKKELDKRLKNGLMSQEAYDAEIKKIDEETDRRQAELAYNQAVRQKVVAAFDIITNTAAGVIKTLGQTGFFGIPLAAIVGAMGAAQLGVVLSTPLPELPGKEQGGFLDVNRSQDNKKFRAKNQPDKRGYVSSPTIITGENGLEYIVPDEATSNPTIRPVLDILEMARQNKNLSTLNFPEVYEATVSNRMSGRESGGSLNGRFDSARFDSAQRPGTSSASTSFASTSLSDRSLQTAEMISVLVKLDATVSDLKKKLDDPIQTYVTVHGKNGLSEKLKEYDNLKNNASL